MKIPHDGHVIEIREAVHIARCWIDIFEEHPSCALGTQIMVLLSKIQLAVAAATLGGHSAPLVVNEVTSPS